MASKKLCITLFVLAFGVMIFADETEDISEIEKPAADFSEEERQALDDSAEKFTFQAEINRLMDIIINSLYSNREIFLRELISNGSDALDKIRFLSLTDKTVLGDTPQLEIKVSFDKEAKTITIRDTGIGMTKQDLVKNLGTVAKSGTSQFLEMAQKQTEDDSLSLIGQFGVGFYSIYLVSNTVTVTSKHNDDDQYVWASTANGEFTVSKDPRGNTLGRGTAITLHLKEDAEEFLEVSNLEKIITRYSEFVDFPIYLLTTKTVEEEVPIEETEATEDEDTESDAEDVEVSEESDEEKPKTKKVSKEVAEWKLLNEHKPIWNRPSSDISEEEYNKFFKVLSKGNDDPLQHIHFSGEGGIQFKSLLYVPSKAPFDLYDKYYGKMTGLRLYVRRVLIADEFDDFLPRYLSFVKGVVDSDDLPLNVNRETLQRHKVMTVISKKLTRKVLDMLAKLADADKPSEDEEEPEEPRAEEEEDDVVEKKESDAPKYETFWKQFGKSIKLGIIEDTRNKNRLSKLLRYETTKSEGRFASLQDYIDRMGPKQEFIYYITGESKEAVENSPMLEKLNKLGFEVVYMVEPLDEYVAQSLTEFEGKKLQSITKEGLKLGKEDNTAYKERMKQLEEDYKPLCDYLTEVYQGNVQKVVISNRIAESPAVLVTSTYGWSANMERIMKAQALGDKERMNYMKAQKTLEINPRHPVVKEMKARIAEDQSDEKLKDLAALMYDGALVSSGFQMENTKDFADRVQRILRSGLSIDPDTPVDEEEEFPDDEEENTEDDDEEPEEEVEDDAVEAEVESTYVGEAEE